MIIDLARGWPVVLLLMARLAAEGALAEALSTLSGVEFDDLFAYLLYEVLRPIETTQRRALTACAAIPQPATDELAAVLGMPASDTVQLLRRVPLVHAHENVYAVHPVMRELLLRESTDAPELQRLAGAYAEKCEQYVRAAGLYRLAGEIDAAARSLSQLSISELQSGAAVFELLAIPQSAMRAHPKLAIVFLLKQTAPEDLAFAEDLFAGLGLDEDPETVACVASALATEEVSHNQHDRLQRILDDPRVRRACELPHLRYMLSWIKAHLRVRTGAGKSLVPEMEEDYKRRPRR